MGVTVTLYGYRFERLLKRMREQIFKAFPNLQPDSDLILIQDKPFFKDKVYRVDFKEDIEDEDFKSEHITLTEVTKGNIEHIPKDSLPIIVARDYKRKPKPFEWLACIHFQ